MILSANVTTVAQTMKEIQLPYFCKSDGDYYCVMSDANGDAKIVKVYDGYNHKSISTTPIDTWKAEIIRSEEITEGEFMVVYDAASYINESLLCTLRIAS